MAGTDLIPQISEDTPPMETAIADRNAVAAKLSVSEEEEKQYADKVTELIRTGVPSEPLEKQTIAKWEDSDEYKNAKVGKWGMRMGFGLLIASLVGPLFMRTGAKGALAALTAAINGWKEGDTEKWNEARDTYDRHLKYVQENNERFYKEWKELRAQKYDAYRDQLHAAEMFFTKHGMETKALFSDLVSMDKAILAAYTAANKPKPINRDTRTPEIKWKDDWKKSHPKEKGETDTAYAERLQTDFIKYHPKGGKGGNALPLRPGGTKTPADWVAEVKKEHPDWAPEQVAAEAKKRAGVK